MSKTKSAHRRQPGKPLWQQWWLWLGAGMLLVVGVLMISSGGLASAAPDFAATTLTGQDVRLSDYRGQVVMLNFWATWCPPCRAEMPGIQAAYAERQDEGFTVLAINNAETPAQIQPFAQSLGLQFPIVLDTSSQLQRTFGIRGYPTSIFVDAQGAVYATHPGFVSETDLEAYINEGLARSVS